eukprot:TRINITY_DN3563_c0_g1_i1.p1 TRINITY_DN3563_c0_g1~~TRINITY_DN3563_c0_g1_i1.p1  ORF type:complete len:483 (+),score=84.60 TRINITY_DN3563_c0_g1_i1:208-1449(+)
MVHEDSSLEWADLTPRLTRRGSVLVSTRSVSPPIARGSNPAQCLVAKSLAEAANIAFATVPSMVGRGSVGCGATATGGLISPRTMVTTTVSGLSPSSASQADRLQQQLQYQHDLLQYQLRQQVPPIPQPDHQQQQLDQQPSQISQHQNSRESPMHPAMRVSRPEEAAMPSFPISSGLYTPPVAGMAVPSWRAESQGAAPAYLTSCGSKPSIGSPARQSFATAATAPGVAEAAAAAAAAAADARASADAARRAAAARSNSRGPQVASAMDGARTQPASLGSARGGALTPIRASAASVRAAITPPRIADRVGWAGQGQGSAYRPPRASDPSMGRPQAVSPTRIQNMPAVGSFQYGFEENQQGISALRQVHTEARQLKQWYSNAIQAIRHPTPRSVKEYIENPSLVPHEAVFQVHR